MPAPGRRPTRGAPRTPDGPAPPPVVQRVRLRYAKRGRLRFSSHRDFQRALERALRRIGAPMAYSAGFTPHPKISYAGAAPTGAASEAEYVELGLAEPVDPAELARDLDGALPAGLDVLEAVVVRTTGLADRLEASLWRLELPGVAARQAAAAATALLAETHLAVNRTTKSGVRSVDVRAAVVSLRPEGGDATEAARRAQGGRDDCAILQLVVRHTTPAVRPDDVLAALVSRGLLAPAYPARMTRLAQGPLDLQGDTVTDPLVADRDAVGA